MIFQRLSIFLFLVILTNCAGYQCNYFYKSKKHIKDELGFEFDVYNLQNGDVIADVGAEGGYLDYALAYYYDDLDLTFYIQDVDDYCLVDKELKSLKKHYRKLKKGDLNASFKVVIGDTLNTKLPFDSFDKVIVRLTFHHFSDNIRASMMQNLYNILKDSGTLYIIENTIDKTEKKQCGANFDLWNERDIVNEVEKYNFSLSSKFTDEVNDEGLFQIFVFKKSIE